MFFFNILLGSVIETISENAIRVYDAFSHYPEELVYNSVEYVYGTQHDGAGIYYRKSWFC